MKLFDESPSALLLAAFVFVYAFIGVEVWMVAAPSGILVATILVGVVVTALVIMRSMEHLLHDDGDVVVLAEEAEARAARAARAAAPAPARVAAAPAPARAEQPVAPRTLAGVH